MKVLTVAAKLEGFGGLERAQLEACRQLRVRGHQIDLFYTEPGNLEREWADLVARRIRVDGYTVFRRAPLRSGAAAVRAIAAARRLRPDIVYFHNTRHASSMRLTGRAMVCHLHLPPPPRGSRQDEFGMRGVSRFVAVSQFTAAQWSDALELGADRFSVVPNGVDLDRFSPADQATRRSVRLRLGLPTDRFLVVYAGRIVPDKGLDCALEAMTRLPSANYHFAVFGEANSASFGGDATAADAYERELRARYTDGAITWFRRVKDVSQMLAAADAVVLPSRFDEPQGLIVLESLASGTPVVASAVGGITEMLIGPLAVNLVPPDEPIALANRLGSLRNWRTDTPALGLIGRRHVERNYTLEAMGDRLNEAFSRAVAC